MRIIKGQFFEGEFITVEINGNIIQRKVRYNHMDGLYIVYNNRKYFHYECDFEEIYKQKGEV